MSIRVMDRVWTHSQSKGIDRLVLLAIADHASDDGGDAWPSIPTLMTKTGLSERGVQSAVHRLVELGELVIETAGGGRGHSNHYRVVLNPAPETPYEKPRSVNGVSETPNGKPRLGVPETPHETSINPAPRAPEPSTNQLQPSRETARARGTRLPDDWKPNDDMREWTLTQLSKAEAGRELTKFRNYWQAKAGAAARKVNWDKVWHNWILRVIEERQNKNGTRLTLSRSCGSLTGR